MASYGDKNALERVFNSYGDHSKCLLERVRDYLDTAPVERSCAPNCSRRIAQAIQRATKEMITNAELTGIKILLDLLLYLSEFPSNGRGLDQLINYNTLPVLLSDMNRFLIGSHKDCNQVIADLIVTVMSLCEYSDKLANSLHLLIPSLLTIAVNNSRYSFTVRIDCVRLLNSLLEACDNQYKVTIKSTLIKFNSKLAMLLLSAGDYELQVAMVECLYRTTTAAERRPLAQQWFSNHDVAKSFLAIREADFEQDCRKFLNVLNKYMERCNEATVFSLPCQQVVLGDMKLQAPQDIKQLWMDFNTVSHSLSVFVSNPTQQEDIWESVIVKRTNIADYKITAVPGGHLLLLTVNIPLSSLISFPCTAKGNNLQVFFTVDPSQVLDRLLHRNSKTSTVMTPVQLGSGKKLSGRVAQSGPQQMSSNIQTPDRVEDVDVSPIDPLGTPVVNSSTGSVCTPPDQSIPVKTPRTSTPSLKTVVANHVDKRMNHSDTLTTDNKAGLDQRKKKTLTLSTKKTDEQGQNSKKIDQQVQNKKTNQQGQNSKKTGQQDQSSKKTDQQGQNSKKTDQYCQNGKKTSTRVCDQTSTRGDFDHKYIVTSKKSVPLLKVTENNIDSFLNQLNTKPKPVTKKYTTRSSIKQSKVSHHKTQSKGQENVTHKQQSSSSIANKTITKKQSYQSASPVVKLQQNKHNRAMELPIASAIGLSAFDFDDEEDRPVTKKPRQVDTSASSSCNSSLEMSRLNASLLARGNTSKSFSMTPQKKGRNAKSKKQSPNKRTVQRKNNNDNSSKANSLEVCVVLESQDVDPTSPPLDGQTTTGTASVVKTTPDDTISSCYSPKSDSTYEPSTNFMPSHETPAAVTPAVRESPDSTAPPPAPAVIEQATSPQVTPVTTQQSSPAVESANISLEYSQPSTPEEDHVITKGFQEVCQELISGAASGRGYNKKPIKSRISAVKEDKMDHFQDEQKENMDKANEGKHHTSKPQPVKQHKRTGLKLSDNNSSVQATSAQATSAQASREQRNKRRRQSTGEMEATPIISPPAKKQSMVRQLDLRITKTPTGKKDVDFNDDDANDNLDHVIPDPTPSGSPSISQPMQIQDDISELLGNFGSKVNQAMKNKRNHYDQVLQGATKASSQLLNSIWSEQYKRRHELLQNYHKKTMEELHLLEEDIKATKQAEEQAMGIFKHHQKTVTDNLTSQKQKLDDLRATQEHFHNDMESLENSHTKQQGNIHQQLKKEMKNIQDEILSSNKQQELRMVKQSLQAMLLKL